MLFHGLLAGLLTLSACSALVPQQPGTSDLTSPVWGLSAIIDKALIPGSAITIEFGVDGKVSGSAGCNQYSGEYTVIGNALQITSLAASTEKACSQDVMDQESAYLQALQDAKTYLVAGSQLILYGNGDMVLLTYESQS